jgi:TonB family protein
VIDAVAQSLADRENLDSGLLSGTGASVLMHAAGVIALLVAVRLQSPPLIPPSLSLSSPPLGDILGIPAPNQSASQRAETSVLKPPTAASLHTTRALPSSTGRIEQPPLEPAHAPGSNTQLSASPPLVVGDPNSVPSTNSWYLAGVQAKIWAVWVSQLRPEFQTPVEVEFTILEDGTVSNPQVTVRSGNTFIDLAATRSIVSAGPFAPLPNSMQAKAFTIRAIFRPER